MSVDILIKNGHVIDPAGGIDQKKDIAVARRKIAQLPADGAADMVIDASGCHVFPGLIDYHTHLYYRGSEYAYHPELLFSTGVTAAVDHGTCGYANYGSFYRNVVAQSDVKIKTFLHIYPAGQYDYHIRVRQRPDLINEERIRETLEEYPGILGLKIHMSSYDVNEYGVSVMEKTVETAEKIGGLQVCVHTTDLPCAAEDIVNMLRKGDIYCHMYSKGNTIVDENGKIYSAVRKARERGVLFDGANGRMHFDFNVAKDALKDNFPPDIISTDVVTKSFNVGPYVKSLPFMMSKYLSLGMSLQDVLKAVTQTPAKAMGMAGQIGTLQTGACADVTICQIKKKRTTFMDLDNSGSSVGEEIIVPVMTIANGKIAYCQTDFN